MYTPFFKTQLKDKTTENLLLRAFQKHDLQAYHKVLNHPDVFRWLGKTDGFSLVEVKQWIDGMQFWQNKHGYAPWAVIHRETGQLVGHCGLKFAEQFSETELMYAIHPDFSGQGYITEAANETIKTARAEYGIEKIIAFTLPHNVASRRVMEKLNMKYAGEISHANLPHVLYEKEV